MGCHGSHVAAPPELVPVGATLSASGSRKQQILCLKVIAANFDRTLDLMGKAFCVVRMEEVDGLTWEVARTKTSWGGSPTAARCNWNYVCRGVLYRGSRASDALRFQVFETNIVDVKAPTSYGETTVAAHELIDDDTVVGSWGTEQTLVLSKMDERVGTITVQAGINVVDAGAGLGQTFTPVDAHLFEAPVKPLAKLTGGATEHYALRLKKPVGTPVDYWLGKDARGAAAEIPFYEKCLSLAKESNPPLGSIKPLIGHVLDYAGVVDVPVVEGQAAGGRPTQMLALQNLLASFENGRMLDLKIGEISLDGTFIKSKTGFGAIRQVITDGLSITAAEGYRLEAFLGQPESLTSRNPLIHTLVESSVGVREKATRIMLQRLTGPEIFMYYADVHWLAGSNSTLTSAEFAEIVLGETVVKLCKYALACREVEAPQRFVHSSIGLAFDCRLPSRRVSEAAIRQGVRVKPFSFKESDTASLEEHLKMDPAARKECAGNWRQYKGGVDRLAWEAARAYENNFGNNGAWEDVVAMVFDFDGANPDDFIGQVTIPLKNCVDQVAYLCDKNWKPISSRGHEPTLTYSVQWQAYAMGSRLRGAWAITVRSASNLPKLDKVLASSDPYVKITASSTNGCQRCVQTTSVVPRSLNPLWNETFELPLGKPTGAPALVSLLDSVESGLGTNMRFQDVLPPVEGNVGEKACKKALRRWQEHLTAPKAPQSPPTTPLTPEIGEVTIETPISPYQTKVAHVIVEEVAEPPAGCGCKAP